MPVTASEAFVAKLCSRAFLLPWMEPNPLKAPGKELCDVLVVCDPDVVILSVKEVRLQTETAPEVGAERWRRRAIEASVNQIYGAERWLRRAGRVMRADGSPGLALPSPETRRVHRIAVALGSGAQVPFEQGDFGRGFVHVLDEDGVDKMLGELDTITDFVTYLMAKEAFVVSGPVMASAEEDVLAVYLHAGRQLPAGGGPIRVEPGSWHTLTSRPEWARRKQADARGRAWDGLVQTIYELVDTTRATSPSAAVDEFERVLRIMAREDRLSRRILSSAILAFVAGSGSITARMAISPSGVVYVFLASARDMDRDLRRAELSLRCFVARGLNPTATTVVGIATEQYVQGGGFSLDGIALIKPSWTEEDQTALEGIQRDLRYFRSPRTTSISMDEYPTDQSSRS